MACHTRRYDVAYDVVGPTLFCYKTGMTDLCRALGFCLLVCADSLLSFDFKLSFTGFFQRLNSNNAYHIPCRKMIQQVVA